MRSHTMQYGHHAPQDMHVMPWNAIYHTRCPPVSHLYPHISIWFHMIPYVSIWIHLDPWFSMSHSYLAPGQNCRTNLPGCQITRELCAAHGTAWWCVEGMVQGPCQTASTSARHFDGLETEQTQPLSASPSLLRIQIGTNWPRVERKWIGCVGRNLPHEKPATTNWKSFAGTQIDIFQGTAHPQNSTQVFFSPLQSSNLKETADTRRQQLRHAKAHNVWPQGMEEGSHNLKALEANDLLPLWRNHPSLYIS